MLYHKKTDTYFKQEDSSYPEAHINEMYEVSGDILDEETGGFLRFKHCFDALDQANKHFDHFKTKYPMSKLKLYKSTWQELRTFL